jgi:hypothetical protein
MDRVSTTSRSGNSSDRSRTTEPGPDAPTTEQLAQAMPKRWMLVAVWFQLVALVLTDAMGLVVGLFVGFIAIIAGVVVGYQTAIHLSALDDADASQAVTVSSEAEA